MQPIEIIVIVAAAALVIFTVVYNLVRRRKLKDKGCCGQDCASCKGNCKDREKSDEKKV